MQRFVSIILALCAITLITIASLFLVNTPPLATISDQAAFEVAAQPAIQSAGMTERSTIIQQSNSVKEQTVQDEAVQEVITTQLSKPAKLALSQTLTETNKPVELAEAEPAEAESAETEPAEAKSLTKKLSKKKLSKKKPSKKKLSKKKSSKRVEDPC